MSTEQMQMRSALGDVFDRTFRNLHDRPDVTFTRLSPIQHVHPVLEVTTSYTIQTARERVEDGASRDTIFITVIGTEGSSRFALPPEVADAIARQRGTVTKKNRRASAKATMAKRMAAGWKPTFGKGVKKRKKKAAKPATDDT